ncbi:MAG: sodium-dependent transporter [Pyramidobacter sp.]|nr:sodium-dependent transporter [Pyramidobacter sp.]
MERESFKSRAGFLLVSAGCAIGIGNVWKFPWLVGQNGGGLFVLIYLLFLVVLGLPVLTMELAVGRASRKSVVGAYKVLKPESSVWQLHGWASMVGNYVLMMFYTTVSGWMLSYFVKFVRGTFGGMPVEQVDGVFGAMVADPAEMGVMMAITVVGGFLVCAAGVRKGLENITKVMMTGLLLLIIVLAVHSLMLPNAGKGFEFYLKPSFERLTSSGIGSVIVAAMNQAFFTLSLGIGSMEIFGTYMSDDHTLVSESVRIVALDTFVALVSGLIIFPACFSFGVDAGAGPGLIFMTLPRVFISMEGGRLWGTLFFLFMTFASFSTVIAVFENILSFGMDNWGWSRKKSVWINCIFMLVASMPCVLGFNVWKDLTVIGSRGVLDSEDFVVSNLLLPIGSLTFLLFCVTKWGWGFDKYMAECNKGTGMQLPRALKPFFQFVLPLLILVILVEGLR